MCMYSKELLEQTAKLRPIDDTFFRLIAERREVCQEILRTLLGDNELVVVDITPQKAVTSLFRGLILDVLCQLGNKKFCNIEVQKGNHNDDVRRVRFHASSITANKTPKSTEFCDVPDVIVLYITEYDALKNGQTTTIVERCQRTENGYKPVEDGEFIVFANTKVDDHSDKAELLQLFLRKDVFKSDKYPAFSDAVRYFKETEKGRDEMCAVVEEYASKKAEEAAKEAAKETAKEAARVMIAHDDKNEYIREVTGLSIEEIESLR